MALRDLSFLPPAISSLARRDSNGEVSWPIATARDAVNALAMADQVVLGLDVRNYEEDLTFYECSWSAVHKFDGENDIEIGRKAALEALGRPLAEGDPRNDDSWILVTWDSPESLRGPKYHH